MHMASKFFLVSCISMVKIDRSLIHHHHACHSHQFAKMIHFMRSISGSFFENYYIFSWCYTLHLVKNTVTEACRSKSHYDLASITKLYLNAMNRFRNIQLYLFMFEFRSVLHNINELSKLNFYLFF